MAGESHARFLAFDMGTSAGRAILGTLREDKLTLDLVHRFPNRAVPVRGTLYWDILHLWHGCWRDSKAGYTAIFIWTALDWTPGRWTLPC